MELTVLCAWILAALAGGHLLVKWALNGGRATKVTRFPLLLVVGHPVAAMAGLALWVAHMTTGRPGYAWAAFVTLLVVILQGFMLLTRWLVGGGGRHARGSAQPFPAVAVTLHGAVALATFVLVLLTVRGV